MGPSDRRLANGSWLRTVFVPLRFELRNRLDLALLLLGERPRRSMMSVVDLGTIALKIARWFRPSSPTLAN